MATDTCVVSAHQNVIQGVFLQEKCVCGSLTSVGALTTAARELYPARVHKRYAVSKEHLKVRRVCDVVMPLQNNRDVSQWGTVRIHALINPIRPVYHYDSR